VPNLPTLISVPFPPLGSLDLLAPVPLPAPLNELGTTLLVGGGPLVNIRGNYPATSPGFPLLGLPAGQVGSHSVGSGLAGPSIDTAPNSPQGLPAWLPSLNKGTMLADEGPIDFLGHAALFVDIPGFDVAGTTVDLGSFLIGQGVTVFGQNPLGQLSNLPLLWDTENPIAAQLNEMTGSLITNPAVLEVLSAALTLVGGGALDLDTVAGLLSDFSTFSDLISAVAGAGGLDTVPGLEAAIDDVLGTVETTLGGPVGGLLATVLGLLAP
jgi:hypothetical protein